MTDLPTKILLVVVAMGVWANVLFLIGVGNHTRRLLDSLDGNLAWTNRHLVKANDKLHDVRVELRSISDQLARQKTGTC